MTFKVEGKIYIPEVSAKEARRLYLATQASIVHTLESLVEDAKKKDPNFILTLDYIAVAMKANKTLLPGITSPAAMMEYFSNNFKLLVKKVADLEAKKLNSEKP